MRETSLLVFQCVVISLTVLLMVTISAACATEKVVEVVVQKVGE